MEDDEKRLAFIDSARQVINDYMYFNVCSNCKVREEMKRRGIDIDIFTMLREFCTNDIKMFCILIKILDKLREKGDER